MEAVWKKKIYIFLFFFLELADIGSASTRCCSNISVLWLTAERAFRHGRRHSVAAITAILQLFFLILSELLKTDTVFRTQPTVTTVISWNGCKREEPHEARKARRRFSLLTWLNMSYTLCCYLLFFVCFIILPTMLPNHMTFINEVTQFMVSRNKHPFFKYLWFALTNRVEVCHRTCYTNLRADRSADTTIRCGWECGVKITGEVTAWKVTMSKLDELVWWAVFTLHSLLSDKGC